MRDAAVTYWHQTCSAKMGRDPMSVVDSKLRVYGIDRLAHRLWLGDASDHHGKHDGAVRHHRREGRPRATRGARPLIDARRDGSEVKKQPMGWGRDKRAQPAAPFPAKCRRVQRRSPLSFWPLRLLASVIRRITAWNEMRRSLSELRRVDDRTLRDIGLDRSKIECSVLCGCRAV